MRGSPRARAAARARGARARARYAAPGGRGRARRRRARRAVVRRAARRAVGAARSRRWRRSYSSPHCARQGRARDHETLQTVSIARPTCRARADGRARARARARTTAPRCCAEPLVGRVGASAARRRGGGAFIGLLDIFGSDAARAASLARACVAAVFPTRRASRGARRRRVVRLADARASSGLRLERRDAGGSGGFDGAAARCAKWSCPALAAQRRAATPRRPERAVVDELHAEAARAPHRQEAARRRLAVHGRPARLVARASPSRTAGMAERGAGSERARDAVGMRRARRPRLLKKPRGGARDARSRIRARATSGCACRRATASSSDKARGGASGLEQRAIFSPWPLPSELPHPKSIRSGDPKHQLQRSGRAVACPAPPRVRARARPRRSLAHAPPPADGSTRRNRTERTPARRSTFSRSAGSCATRIRECSLRTGARSGRRACMTRCSHAQRAEAIGAPRRGERAKRGRAVVRTGAEQRAPFLRSRAARNVAPRPPPPPIRVSLSLLAPNRARAQAARPRAAKRSRRRRSGRRRSPPSAPPSRRTPR